jgi:NAD(P)H-dependent flavin oxidoreductase YrpB (nitropropane dioxygenase family)
MHAKICDDLGIEFPIFAFSHCRDVVAAVSRAGGLGMLGALAFTPEQLELELRWIDEHVDGKPYGVDVVIPASHVGSGIDDVDELLPALEDMVPEKHKQFIERVLEEHSVPPLPDDADDGQPSGLLGWTNATSRPQVEVALSHDIALLANALGPPPKEVIDQAHEHGVPVAALVGRADQAQRQVEQGTDIIIAQGYEAGGHTGEIATMVLLPEVVKAVGPDVPVLAAGGIGSGRQMAAAMALGAHGVWTGSIWLTVAEADTQPLVQEKLLEATSRDTVRTRAMTGKPARLLRTAWTDAWESEESPGTLPMPLQYLATAEAQRRIARSQARDLVGMPVGQIVGQMNQVRTTREVILDMVDEYIDVVNRLHAGLSEGA